VLAGIAGAEDAGVYRLDQNTALIQTVDFFTPIVDDPRVFGRIAAANALSDVYAMGGRPITAMNIVCFPVKKLPIQVLRDILGGGLDTLKEAGVALVGGHSVEDDEPKYGLAVAGLVHPDRIMTNDAFTPGDKIILTKAVGTGVVTTAIKAKLAEPGAMEAAIACMAMLNRSASEVARYFGVRGCTDVTGFGLAGHLVEIARASRCAIRLDSSAVPLLEGALDYASMVMIPAGGHANREFFSDWVSLRDGIEDEIRDLMYDPQTSGGLLIGVPRDRAEELKDALTDAGVVAAGIIAEVADRHPEGHVEVI
jgi:selenide,water dikinase